VIQVDQSIRHLEDLYSLNERSLDILVKAINSSQGSFSLIVINCNYRNLRQKILTALTTKTGWLCREIWWRESHENLYGKLQNLLRDGEIENIPALMCLGLEQTSANNPEDFAKLFFDANLFRDRLKKHLKCPLVLWLDDLHLQQLLVTAPELANLAAPPIKFELAPMELAREVHQQVERLFEITRNPQIPLFWQDSKIDADRDAFSYSELELARRELRIAQQQQQNQHEHPQICPEMEAKLDFVLGRLLWRSPEAPANEVYEESQGEVHSVSQIYYQCSLAYWQKEHKAVESGIVLFYLGNLWWHNSFVNGRQAYDSWIKAKKFFQEAIAAFKRAERNDLIAKYSRAYSGVLEQLREWQELEQLIQALLPLHEQMPLELAQDYGYLAKIAVERRDWAKVKEYSSHAIATLEKAPIFDDDQLAYNWQRLRQIQVGQYQLLLTQSHFQLKELDLAAALMKSMLANFNFNDEPKLYIRFLDTFHDIAFAQGLYLQAFQTRKKQRSLEQQYGLRAFIGAGVLQPKQFSPNPSIAALDTSRFDVNASEIVASGRNQDVERLVERILSVEHQLTVIHGESGVGKSSLVRAGLIPALLQRSLTGQELIPIKIRVYTDWVNAISFALYVGQDFSNGFNIFRDDVTPIPPSHRRYRERRKNGDRDAANLLNKLKQVANSGTQIVLIFDQFEEFFFTYNQPQEREVFIDFWRDCLKIPLLKLVVSIREDYLYLLLELESAHAEVDILSRNFRYALGNLSPSDAKSLIENLTEQANFPLEPVLIDELVRDLAGDRGTVRPIELQLVGSQLQDRNINTLAAYRLAGGKQRLVEQSVEEVIQACGKSAFIAQQVLVLLTDEQGKRPLRTYNELRTGILPYSGNTADLDLVLEILIGSGLIFQLSDVDSNRYQLIHDYLVTFIRANQEAGLQAELIKVRSSAQRSQTNFNRLTKFALVGTALGLFIMAGLAFQANRQRQLAEFGEIEALISSAKSSFLLNNQLEALATVVKSAKKLNNTSEGLDRSRITKLNLEALQMIVYSMRERYRFNPQKMDAPFYAAKFSHNGNIMAFGSYDGSVYLFQSNGKPISRLIGFNAIEIRGLSFSPDDRQIASVGQGKSVRIWDVETGKLVAKFYAHQDDIFRVHFHPQGKMLLTASKDGTAKLWDRDRGMEIVTIRPTNIENNPIKSRGADAIQDASFSPDGNLIVTAKGRTISLWNLQGQLLTSAIAHDKKIHSVSFHPDGKQLATSGSDETVKIWKIVEKPITNPVDVSNISEELPDGLTEGENRTGSEPAPLKSVSYQLQLTHTFKTNATDILSVKFSADGQRIALGAQDNSIQILNLEGAIEMKLGGHTNAIFDVNFSPSGRYLLSASKDRTVRLWDLKATLLDTIYGHTDNIWSVNFSPDGKIFASGGVDKSVRLWNADGSFRQELKGHEDTVYGVSFSADGKKLVSASTDKTVKIWDRTSGKLLHTLNIHGSGLVYATFSPDQKTLVTLGIDNKIKLWQWDNTDKPKLLHVLDGHKKEVWAIAFSPDSQSLASTSNDQTVRIWNVKTGQNTNTMEAHLNGGLAVAYSPDGKQIASAGKDGKVKLWNAQTGILEKVITVNVDSWIYGINFSPNGRAIATANADKTIKIVDLESGEILKNLVGHTAEVNAVSYSPNGEYLISASRDNTLKLWNAETLTFNELVQRGCNLLENYLEYTPTLTPDQKQLCKQ
jgi:WD40 repeat protein